MPKTPPKSDTQPKPEKSERRRPADAAEEVAPGILRIMLPIELPGLGHVNCYALEDKGGIALIDPGLADGVSHQVLTERLADAGLDIARVHTAVATHSHFDHFGGIARLRALETAQPVAVYAHATFGAVWREAYDELLSGPESEDSASLDTRTDDEVHNYLLELAGSLRRETPWGTKTDGFPVELIRAWSEGINPIDTLRPPEVTHPLHDGDTIELGGKPWTAMHTPGHADDHVCLWNGELGVMFGGDHLLPNITPHISGFSTFTDPLGEFFESLERVAGVEGIHLVLPAHGDPFGDPSGRCEAIADHHHGRLDRLREIGAEIGNQPVEGYMKLLFRERSWGMMAASETYAHLEWLRLHSNAKRTTEGKSPHYHL